MKIVLCSIAIIFMGFMIVVTSIALHSYDNKHSVESIYTK